VTTAAERMRRWRAKSKPLRTKAQVVRALKTLPTKDRMKVLEAVIEEVTTQ